MLFQLAITIGILVANVINYFTAKVHHGWRYSLGCAAIPAILLIIGALVCPETPNSLIERGLVDEGRKVLQRIRGTQNVDAEYFDIVEASEVANKVG